LDLFNRRGVDVAHLSDEAKYRSASGEDIDSPLASLAAHGVTHARISLWVGHDKRQNLPRALRVAQRARDAGLAVYLALHLSDSWADPSQQRKPASWRGLPLVDLAAAVNTYVRDVLDAMQQACVAPDIVQIGNEITNGLLWEESTESWFNGGRLFNVDPGKASPCARLNNWPGMVCLLDAASSAIRAHAALTGNESTSKPLLGWSSPS
jgi:arabinogalactan endo-1,4-beta-galactosidase